MNFNEVMELNYDKDFRKKLRNNPVKYGQLKIADDVKIVVVTNTKDTVYLPLPDNKQTLTSVDIAQIQAAGTASTGGSLSSVSTASGSTISTIASAGTIGTLS